MYVRVSEAVSWFGGCVCQFDSVVNVCYCHVSCYPVCWRLVSGVLSAPSLEELERDRAIIVSLQ